MKVARRRSSESWTWDLTQRECVKRGWIVRRVSWRDQFGRSHDLFGCIDAIAFDEQPILSAPRTIGIQFTSAANRAARRKKMAEMDLRKHLTDNAWLLLVWSWRIKDGKPVLAEDVL